MMNDIVDKFNTIIGRRDVIKINDKSWNEVLGIWRNKEVKCILCKSQ
ncbi:MAG: hypothetical protein HC854_17295 [Flavobacterium sp.]|nr:hypothetical protein [Flavobacterium sp.]